MIKDLIRKNRSYRRFYQEVQIDKKTLEEFVDMARLSASAKNLQPLKYLLSWEPEMNASIFPLLGWAGYLKDWPGPAEGERPSAYIIILLDKKVTISNYNYCDIGIAAQSILMSAVKKGLGGCMIGSIKRNMLRDILKIPDQYEIKLVIALGKPSETVVLDPLGPNKDVRYWRDDRDIHHVPKRSLKDIIIRGQLSGTKTEM